MRCLEGRCQYYNSRKSRIYCCNYCEVTEGSVPSGCRVDTMIEYTEKQLIWLKSVRKYLTELKEG